MLKQANKLKIFCGKMFWSKLLGNTIMLKERSIFEPKDIFSVR